MPETILRWSPRPIALIACLMLSACGRSPPTVMLTLDAAAPRPEAVRADYRGVAISIPAVHVPAALDRQEFASERSAARIDLDDFAKWSAPLPILARDALIRNLTARLPAGAVMPPGAASDGRSLVIDVSILSISERDGQTTMTAAYRCLPTGIVQQEMLRAPSVGSKPTDAAQNFSTLLGKLADQIAATVGTEPCIKYGGIHR